MFLFAPFSKSECICDKTEFCDPYCSCDPDCPFRIIRRLPFTLPSKLYGEYDTYCDINNNIDISNKYSYYNLNGTKCFYVPKEDIVPKQIKSSSLRINNYSSILADIPMPQSFNSDIKSDYFDGQPMYFDYNLSEYATRVMVGSHSAFGSFYRNVYFPVRSATNFFGTPFIAYREDFSLYLDLNFEIMLGSGNVLFHIRPNQSTTEELSMSIDTDAMMIYGKYKTVTVTPNNNNAKPVYITGSETPYLDSYILSAGIVQYESLSVTSDIDYLTQPINKDTQMRANPGYSVGSPLFTTTNDKFVHPIYDGSDLLDAIDFVFGSEETVFVPKNFKLPESFLRSWGAITLIQSGDNLTENDLLINLNYTEEEKQCSKIDYTFYYRKFGFRSAPFYAIINVSYLATGNISTEEKRIISTHFIEIDHDDEPLIEQGQPRYNMTFGQIFKFLFESHDNINRSSAVLLVIVFIACTWIFYDFWIDEK